MSEQKKVISISTVRKKVIGPIEVDGVEHQVYQLDFGTNQKLTEASGTVGYLTAVREAVKTVCPSLRPEQIDALGLDDGAKIVAFSSAGMKAVEAMFPNGESPEIPTSPG